LNRVGADGRPARVLLVGMMGVGKTTVGRQVARRLGWAFVDSDEEVFRSTGLTVPEIFARQGEAAFRLEESRVLLRAAGSDFPVVIAFGGGVVLAEANRQVIREAGMVVWLRADVELLVARVGNGDGRPLLEADPAGTIRRLDMIRRPLYQALADLVIDVDAGDVGATAERIVSAVAGFASLNDDLRVATGEVRHH
jgi:shikimate kinase